MFNLLEKLKQVQSRDDKFDLNDICVLERNMLLFQGLYPLKSKSKLEKMFHHFRSLFVVVGMIDLIASLSLSIVFEPKDIVQAAEVLEYLITVISCSLKTFNFIYNRSKLFEIEQHLSDPNVYKFYNIFGREGMDAVIYMCNLMMIGLRSGVSVFCILFVILPIFHPNDPLPLPGYFLMDQLRYRAIVLPLQAYGVISSAFANATVDLFSVYCISIGIGQLKLLKQCLANVDYTLARNEIRKKDKDVNPKISSYMLQDIVSLHKHTIRYIEMVENMFSYGIFVQFFASIGVICMIGLQTLIIKPGSTNFYSLICYFFCVMGEVVMYCWFGNDILYESEGISNACYLSNWYEGTTSDKKVLYLIMERSKREIKITAGKFLTLSLSTLIMILKSAYSYYAVLQQYYKDKNVLSS